MLPGTSLSVYCNGFCGIFGFYQSPTLYTKILTNKEVNISPNTKMMLKYSLTIRCKTPKTNTYEAHNLEGTYIKHWDYKLRL